MSVILQKEDIYIKYTFKLNIKSTPVHFLIFSFLNRDAYALALIKIERFNYIFLQH